MNEAETQRYAELYERLYGHYLGKKVEVHLPLGGVDDLISVIDLGCGTGGQLRNIREQNRNSGSRFFGIDSSPHMITRATLLTDEGMQDSVYFAQCSFLGASSAIDLSAGHKDAKLIFLCLGNTLALVDPSELPNMAKFLKNVMRGASFNSAELFLEIRCGEEYSRWVNGGRIEELNYDATNDRMLLSFQVLSPQDNGQYITRIYSLYKEKGRAEFCFLEEPHAHFVFLHQVESALEQEFSFVKRDDTDTVVSGLKRGHVSHFTLTPKS